MWGNLRRIITNQWGKSLVDARIQFCRNARTNINRSKMFHSLDNGKKVKRYMFSGLVCHAGLLTFMGVKTEPKTAEQEVTDIVKMAILAQQENQLNKAEQLLHLALKIAQEQLGPMATTHIFDMMAELALEAGDHVKAESLFKEVLKRLMSNPVAPLAEDDNAVMEISIKLANIYSETGRAADAQSGYDFCVQRLAAKMKTSASTPEAEDTTMLWVIVNDSLGRHRMRAGDHQKAIGYFETALDTCKRLNGPEHPITLVMLNNLGSATSESGNHSAALPYVTEALRIAVASGSTELSSFHCNLAIIYMNLGRLDEATESAKAALSETSATSPSDAECRKNAYKCLQEIGKLKKAGDPKEKANKKQNRN